MIRDNTISLNQLTFGITLKEDATFHNFYADTNFFIVNELKKASKGEGEQFIYLYGAKGEGRTHLLQATCHEASSFHLRAVYIPLKEYKQFSCAIFEGMENLDLICLDDISALAGKKAWEEAFFHLYNRVRESKTRLIMTSDVLPNMLTWALPDVLSRLYWGLVCVIKPLNDVGKLKILLMRAKERGIILSEEVGKFILNHCPRHLTTLFTILDKLDAISLSQQRKLTIPFVKCVLNL